MDNKSDFSISGEPSNFLPKDLYIPPDALEVILEVFSGPLDLLLYLIRKQNLDILDIPISDITKQYMKYIELMRQIKFDLAGEYLVMAATLAEIKSRMLLPKIDDDEDPDALSTRARFAGGAGGRAASISPRKDEAWCCACAAVFFFRSRLRATSLPTMSRRRISAPGNRYAGTTADDLLQLMVKHQQGGGAAPRQL